VDGKGLQDRTGTWIKMLVGGPKASVGSVGSQDSVVRVVMGCRPQELNHGYGNASERRGPVLARSEDEEENEDDSKVKIDRALKP
jgi:hypothetical protein